MNILELITTDYTNYNEAKAKLIAEPYNLKIKESEDLFLLQKNKLPEIFSINICYECNGTIFEKNTNKVICYGSDCLYKINETNELDNLNLNNENILVQKYYDGTLIKVYYYNNKWNYSTNGCIDAFESNWISDKSFGELFNECIPDTFENMLNKEFCYTFILIHPENRNVVKNSNKKIIHISTRDLNTLEEITQDIGIETPEYIDISLEEIKQSFSKMEYNNPGYIIYDKTQQSKKYSLTNESFNKVKNMKGNLNNINKICINSILNKNDLLKYYPELKESHGQNTILLNNLVKELFILYKDRHIYHNFKVLPPNIHYIIKNIHDYYKTQKQKITPTIINSVLKKYIDVVHNIFYNKKN